MLATATRTPTPDLIAELAGRLPARLEPADALELEAVLEAIDERLETASPDVCAILLAGRRRLELELAELLAA